MGFQVAVGGGWWVVGGGGWVVVENIFKIVIVWLEIAHFPNFWSILDSVFENVCENIYDFCIFSVFL